MPSKVRVEQVNKAMQQLDQVVQQNASAAEEMSTGADQLAQQSELLQSAIAIFKLGADQQTVTPRKRPAPVQARAKGLPAKKPEAPSAAAESTHGHRPGKSNGANIDLGANNGNSDSRDSEFTAYQA